MFNDDNNYNKVLEFLNFLASATLWSAIATFICFLIVPDVVLGKQFLCISLSMAMVFMTIFTFMKTLIPPEMKDDIERMAHEEAEEIIKRMFPNLYKENKKKKEDKKDDENK